MTDMRMTAEEKKEFTLTLLRFFSSEIDDIPDVSEIYNQKMRKEREALTQYVRQRFIDIEQIGIEKIGTDKLTQDKMDIAIKSIVANIVGEALSDVYKEIDAEAIISESEQQAAIEQVTQTIKSIVPQNHVMPNNTLMNVLQSKEVINAGAFDMSVMPATKRRKEVTAYVDVSMETQTDSGITITNAHLTEYERQVYDAIITLWITANEEQIEPIFTLDMIYRNMPGSGERATPQQKGAITKAIERFRRLHIVLDATEEMRRRGKIGEKSTFTMDDYFLTATRAKYTVEKGGQEVIAYKITSKPLNLIYAEMTKQILTVPVKVITFSKVKPNPADKSLVTISTEPITMNESRQAMAGYLLRRICVMKHDLEEAKEEKRSYDRKRRQSANKDLEEKPVEAFRKQSDVILFSTLFEATGTATDNRDKALDNRKFCYEILEYWKAIKFIADYEEQKKGRSITGIKITL
jgi:hypothetical protein